LVAKTLESMRSEVGSRGIRASLKRFKTSRLMVLRYISGAPLTSGQDVANIDGWPKWLREWKGTDPTGLRVLLSILSIGRAITLRAVIDFSTIESPQTGDPGLVLDSEMRRALKELKIRSLSTEWTRYHMSTKSGPMGQAITCALNELAILPQTLRDSISTLAGNTLKSNMDALMDIEFRGLKFLVVWSWIFPNFSKCFRRLSFFGDKEGKTRVIGILDYWSQTALKPLHDSAIACLKRIEPDCTFDQNSFVGKLPLNTMYHSLDLHAATDRIPSILTERMLAILIGADKARAWKDILTGYAFNYGSTQHFYAVGQPMGAYSSWPVGLALIHHVLVRIAAHRVGKTNFKDYVLLGDDIIIADTQVSESYSNLMASIGVEINDSKTFHSETVWEFAKRNFYLGKEITALSASGLMRSWKRYYLFSNYLLSQARNGWNIEQEVIARVISCVYKFYGRRDHQIKSAIKLSRLYLSILDDRKLLSKTGEGDVSLTYSKTVVSDFILPFIGDESSFSKEIWNATLIKIVSRDIDTLGNQLTSMFQTMLAKVSWMSMNLGDQPYIDQEWRFVSEALRVWKMVPMVSVIQRQYEELQKWNEDHFGEKFITSANPRPVGISELSFADHQFFIPNNIFSMRRDHVVSVTTAGFGKALLSTWRDYIFPRVSSETKAHLELSYDASQVYLNNVGFDS
jgi:hypothetical protein